MSTTLFFILTAIFLFTVLLDRTLHSWPLKELRRLARNKKDKKASRIYKMAAFGSSAEFFLRLIGAFSAAGLILLAVDLSWWLGLTITLLVLALTWKNKMPKPVNGWRLWLASIVAPLAAKMIAFLQPLLGRFTNWYHRINPQSSPTGIFEKEDLLDFLKVQAYQPTNRVATHDLKAIRGVLSLEDKKVGQVMLPRRKIKWVAASDPIGPMIMDELHKTGQKRFLVVKEITKSKNPEIVGVLYLKDLLDKLDKKGKIDDIMHPGVSYVNESQNLRSSLDAFLKSGKLLLVVVNNFEEIVGQITLEDVIGQIFGDELIEEFDTYDDIRAVATYLDHHSGSQLVEAEVE
jgi:CBS domain containing-hemolysin-like protein